MCLSVSPPHRPYARLFPPPVCVCVCVLYVSLVQSLLVAYLSASLALCFCPVTHTHTHTMQAVIFCNTRRKVDWLTAKMREANFTVSAMHGEMPQKERSAIMEEFRSGARFDTRRVRGVRAIHS